MDNQNRIYSRKVDVSGSNIQEFYDRRAKKYLNGEKSQYTTVLLGDNNPDYAKKWHEFEKDYVLNFLNVKETHSVLDIGCGIGRWAENVLPTWGRYVGTDFSLEMTKAASKRYENEPKAKFINSNFQNIFSTPTITDEKFDTVIIAGVSMYINDGDLRECYRNLGNIVNQGSIIYIEESVGVKERLTLNHIWSESLDDNYDAIYRTREEYLEMLAPLVAECDIVKEGYFEQLDKKELSETSHWYAILRKK